MFTAMSSIILSKRTRHFWSQIALLTQMVCDSCMESMKSQGVEVAVAESSLLFK